MSFDLAWLKPAVLEGWTVRDGLARAAQGICNAFGADRISIFVPEGEAALVALLQQGLSEVATLRVPIAPDKSIAGYVATHRRLVNVTDVYDDAELAAFEPPLVHLRAADSRTRYRTRQVLAAPIIAPGGDKALGVVELLNRIDRKRFPKECEEAVVALCAILVELIADAPALERRNPFTRTAAPERLRVLEVPDLKARADGALREDAPKEAANARERLLHLYRDLHRSTGHLDPFTPNLKRTSPWTAGDLEAMEWLCRLDEAGHVGATRLLDRFLQLRADGFDNTLRQVATVEGAAGLRLKVLAHRHPKVAQCLVKRESERPDADLVALLEWAQLGGPEHASLAAALREIYPSPQVIEKRDLEILHVHLKRARGKDGEQIVDPNAGANLLAEVARSRLQYHRLKPETDEDRVAARRLQQRAAELGSPIAREAMWEEAHASAPDPRSYFREWLAADPDPRDWSSDFALRIGAGIEEGEAGAAEVTDAMPWYARVVPGMGRTDVIEARDCLALASRIHYGRRGNGLAMRWYARGASLGDEASLRSWLALGADAKSRTAIDAETAWRRTLAFFAARGKPSDNLLEGIFPVSSVTSRGLGLLEGPDADPAQAARWLEVAAWLGDAAAQFRLGKLLEEGKGVERNAELARLWLERAASGENRAAIAELPD